MDGELRLNIALQKDKEVGGLGDLYFCRWLHIVSGFIFENHHGCGISYSVAAAAS